MPHPPSVNSDASSNNYSSNHWKYNPAAHNTDTCKPTTTYDVGYKSTAIKSNNMRIMRWLNDVADKDSDILMGYAYDPNTLDLSSLDV